MKLHLASLVLVLQLSLSVALVDPFSSTFVVGTAAASAIMMLGEYVGLTTFRCKVGVTECCGDSHIVPRMNSLQSDLSELLYGQHIAQTIVYKAVKFHLNDNNPQKTLVMSFHGWTGSGKNHVVRLIARNIYKRGENSSFFHIFNSEVHFKHKHQISLYKDQLQSWIKGNVSRCSRSVFVFDEIDHMPEGLIDAIKPFLGTEPSIDKVDYRKSIFIFLSNTGGNDIVTKCLEVWKEGKQRNSIALSDMQEILQLNAYNMKGGLQFSGVIAKNLIDHFIPFLPLEREHIRLCIRDEIKRISPSSNIKGDETNIEEVLQELQWFPSSNRLYSKSGCKKIAQKVALVLSN